MAGGPMADEWNYIKQAQNQHVDPRDYLSPQQYQQALRDAQQQANLIAGQRNMAQGLAMTATQMQAQQQAQKQAMMGRAFAMQQDRLARSAPTPPW